MKAVVHILERFKKRPNFTVESRSVIKCTICYDLLKTALACLVIVGWLFHAVPAYADSGQSVKTKAPTTQAGERAKFSNAVTFQSYDHLPVGTKGSFSRTGSGYGYGKGGRSSYKKRSRRGFATKRKSHVIA